MEILQYSPIIELKYTTPRFALSQMRRSPERYILIYGHLRGTGSGYLKTMKITIII
jgi:hypothetical protein